MESVTIKDIARIAGVSCATVSRALNGTPSVAPELREKSCPSAASMDTAEICWPGGSAPGEAIWWAVFSPIWITHFSPTWR